MARDPELFVSKLTDGIRGNAPCAIDGESAVISVRRLEVLFASSGLLLTALNMGERFRLP